ncbi:MAG: ComEC/Rec2 family competence protein [Flavobacteriales bacterium]|nr:ComEC/Rec2 family competence protein [Flavobacteriales bacterium]
MGASFRDVVVRAPMVRLVVPFVSGVVAGPWSPLSMGLMASLVGGLFLIWTYVAYRLRAYAQRWWRMAVLAPLLFAFGCFWYQLRTTIPPGKCIADHLAEHGGWCVEVIESISQSARSMRCWVHVRAKVDSSAVKAVEGKLLLTLMKDSTTKLPEPGDLILIGSVVDTIARVPDPGGFDQRVWAASYGAFHQSIASGGQWRMVHRSASWTSLFESSRKRVNEWLHRSELGERERGMVKAILLGIRDELDSEQKSSFARSGTMHVLAVSGSHVALIYAVLLFAFRRFGERSSVRVIRSLIVLIVLWYYAGLTGATPSVLRATVTFSLFCAAEMFGRRIEPVNSLASAAFLLVLWDPYMAWQLSFQLSFLAVVGIALFYQPLMHLWYPPNEVMRYFWSLLCVSLAAQATTTPLAIYAFKAFPAWFLPANMIVVGLVALGVYGGALLLFLHSVPLVGDAITWCMQWLLRAIGYVTDLFAHLPGAYPGVRISAVQCLGLYALVLLIAAWIFEGWRWARTGAMCAAFSQLLLWGWNAHEQNMANGFVVYDERDRLVCATTSGRTLTVFTDTVDTWTQRKIEQHERACGAVRTAVLKADMALIDIGGSRIAFAKDDPDITTTIEQGADLVVLHGDHRFDAERLISAYHPREGFVLAPTIRAGKRAFLRDQFKALGVAVHDVRLHGAYVR